MRNVILTLLLLPMAYTGVRAQQSWQLKRDEDGIKIYTANTEISCFKSIKVVCTVNATPSQLIAFLMDIKRQPEWVYNTKSSRLLKKIKENELVFYSEVNVPWPCTNRDYIAHFSINQVSPILITIDSKAEPDLLPVEKGLVRVKSSIAHWDITTVNPHLLSIIYTVQFDPGGSVPAWLTNLFVGKGPYSTFSKLRSKVNDPVYQNAHVDFIK
ncbi:MAG: lipid-binding protein [Flavipsychrobacter sp.]|nr:lipid-binding protein [Flavipsychrobacter sp.]